ncbi:MAG: hypothetical protein ABIT16_06655 [Croceibacterium sp.]
MAVSGQSKAGGAWSLSAACAALLLQGCGGAPSDAGPGKVTQGEARALSDAGEMLGEQRLPPASPVASASPAPSDTANTP